MVMVTVNRSIVGLGGYHYAHLRVYSNVCFKCCSISTQLHQHTRCQPFQKFFKRSRVQLRAHFVRVAEAVILMRRRSRSMQQRLVSSLVSAARCHVYTCHILPCGTHVIFCHAIVRELQRSLRGAFLVHLPSAPRVARDTHTTTRAH